MELSTIKGITVDEIDWKKHLADKSPKLDTLAGYIPADQHVVFFSSFEAAMALADEADEQGTPLVELAEPQSQDAGVLARYQRQIGLKTTTLGRMLGPSVIKSMALTGGDPYFRIGTDLALVFEARDLATLKAAIIGQISLNTKDEAGLAITAGHLVEGDSRIPYDLWSTPDRRVNSYVAAYENCVVVTNSLSQVKNLFAVFAGKKPSIAKLDEYRLFRNRYPLGDGRNSVSLPQRRHDTPLVQPTLANRRFATHSRLGGAGGIAGRKCAEIGRRHGRACRDSYRSATFRFRRRQRVLTPAGVYSKTLGSLGL